MKRGPKQRPLAERFENLMIPEPMSGCWLWLGAAINTYRKRPTGCQSSWRPVMKLGTRSMPVRQASQVAWELYVGPRDETLEVCHSCDNSWCVNPSHLYQATHKDNMQDAQIRGRMAGNGRPRGKACPHGHPYTPENTRWRICRGKPLAACRTCERIARQTHKETDAYRAMLDRRIENRRLQRTTP